MKYLLALTILFGLSQNMFGQNIFAQSTNLINSATNPIPGNAKWLLRHQTFIQQAQKGNIDLLFIGDSITDWFSTRGSNVWNKYYAPLHAADFGIAGDRVEQVLWRIKNGELRGIRPKLIVLMIGTNNKRVNTTPEIAEGISLIVKELRTRLPDSKILLLGIFPSGERVDPVRDKEQNINLLIAKLDDGEWVKYLDIGQAFLESDGVLSRDIMPDLLHPNEKGYDIWAHAIQPVIEENFLKRISLPNNELMLMTSFLQFGFD